MNSRPLPRVVVLSALGALALPGCAGDYSANVGAIDHAAFGEANRQTFAAMIVDPDPVYEEPLETSAEHAADAVERYRERAVVQPVAEDTTSVSGGGGGGG